MEESWSCSSPASEALPEWQLQHSSQKWGKHISHLSPMCGAAVGAGFQESALLSQTGMQSTLFLSAMAESVDLHDLVGAALKTKSILLLLGVVGSSCSKLG